MLKTYFIPAVTMLIAMLGVRFQRPAGTVLSKAELVIYTLLVCCTFFQVLSGRSDDLEKDLDKQQIQSLNDKINAIENSTRQFSNDSSVSSKRIEDNILIINQQLNILVKRGMSVEKASMLEKNTDTSVVKRLIDQSNAAEVSLHSIDAPQRLNPRVISIQYFPKEVDGEIIRKEFLKYGFTLRAGKSNSTLLGRRTNAIWYGINVKVNEVRTVALILMRAGISLVKIEKMKLHNNIKDNVIQIGTTVNFTSANAIDVESVDRLH